RDFLTATVGYFKEDPRLFLVQTPHIFSNPDPLEKNLRTFEHMPSENEMFYGTIQKGLDKWNAAFFCGSAALLRREALTQVGGFSGISITEDCETALDLHSRGWNSLYVDKPLISGLQPESFASFIGQRSRWARGMFQIFLLKNPIFKRGLSPAQKICYLSNMMYWFFSFPRLSFFVAPLLYIFFSMHIYQANLQEFFAYTVIYMIANMLMQNRLYGTVRWPWVSELYEYVQSLFLCRGLLSVVLNPWKPTFNVTDKGQSLEQEHLSELATPYLAMFGLLVASSLVVGWRYCTEPDSSDLLAVVAIWNAFNLLLAGISLGVVSERRTPRANIDRYAELALGTAIVPVHISDVSYGGCRLEVEEHAVARHLRKGAIGVLSVRTSGENGIVETLPVVLNDRTVKDQGWLLGFEFSGLRAQHYRVLVDLMYSDSTTLEAMRQKRRRQKGLLAGMVGFARWWLNETARGLHQFARQYWPKVAALTPEQVDAAWAAETAEAAKLFAVAVSDPLPAAQDEFMRLPSMAAQH
ncbi:MAG: glycosyltransferase, partial [Methylobacteriaceae bacterium]|nr:glycosyltransferase [Methylobacteriaceae bacterium]